MEVASVLILAEDFSPLGGLAFCGTLKIPKLPELNHIFMRILQILHEGGDLR